MGFDQYKVVIVDDLDVNLVLAGDILSSIGCTLITAKNARELFDIIDGQKVDLILLDIMLPGIDGYEICRFLKSDKDKSSIPIIFLTAKNDRDDVIKGLECGAVDYITKPFYAKELLYRVKTQLEIREQTKLKELHEKDRLERHRRESVLELISNISHHWRQPLTIINMAAINAKNRAEELGYEDAEILNSLEIVSSNCSHLSNVIEIFRNRLNKNEETKLFNLKKALEDTLMLVLDSRLARIDVIDDIPDSLEVHSCYATVSEVFMILLKNIIEVSEERDIGDPKVLFCTEVVGDRLKIYIKDNLGGIEEGIIDKIFDPYLTTFFPSSHKGLGLYIAKRLVEEELLGDIRVQNVDKGTQVEIEIPFN